MPCRRDSPCRADRSPCPSPCPSPWPPSSPPDRFRAARAVCPKNAPPLGHVPAGARARPLQPDEQPPHADAAFRPEPRARRPAPARLGLHALVRFDSVAPPVDGERRLYESLALLLEQARPKLQRLIEDHEAQAAARLGSGQRLIAELLVDVAACRRSVAAQPELERGAIRELHDAVRGREQRCVEALLRLYAFRKEQAAASELPLLDGRWGDDLFNPETLKQLGVKIGSGMVAGAAAGAGVDLMVGGITLGAAALLGAIAGGGAQTARHYGNRLLGKLKGQRELSVDDAVLRLLALRQRQLLAVLATRGHAATEAIRLATPQDQGWREGKLPEALQRCRAHPEWSSLNPGARLQDGERQAALDELETQLQQN
ncbi:DUF3482 domain-containing protein [Methylobacterium organophilum]|nr:DUF3482 domain-containing protein [Methylobacterium organophilum]